jgi:hypothetical protein
MCCKYLRMIFFLILNCKKYINANCIAHVFFILTEGKENKRIRSIILHDENLLYQEMKEGRKTFIPKHCSIINTS